MAWRVRLTSPAEADLRALLDFTRSSFGSRQASVYRATVLAALAELRDGPVIAGSASRDDLPSGLRLLHIARHGRRGRHLVLYRVSGKARIDVLRILHDAMDLPRHVPKA